MCRTGISWCVTPPWLLASMRQLNRSQKSFHRSESWLTIALHLLGYDAKSLGVLISVNRKLPDPHHPPSLGRRKAQFYPMTHLISSKIPFLSRTRWKWRWYRWRKKLSHICPRCRHHNIEIWTAMMLTLLEILGNKRPILLCVFSFF